VFLPAAGNRNNSDGTLNNVGSNGNYWSSTPHPDNSENAYNMNFNSEDANTNNNWRSNGFSVRCVSELNEFALCLLLSGKYEISKSICFGSIARSPIP